MLQGLWLVLEYDIKLQIEQQVIGVVISIRI